MARPERRPPEEGPQPLPGDAGDGPTCVSDDVTEEELEELELHLDPADFNIDAMVDAAFEDLYQLGRFLERIADAAGVDDKYARLIQLLTKAIGSKNLHKDVFTPEFKTQKVLVFTEFADTARYLHERLVADKVTDVDRLDGSRSADRVKMIQRFAPHYNKVKPEDRAKLTPLRVLVSTDVLSEGVNLQDAGLVVNYDVHWNPVRLMQRIGRVDRRMDPQVEKALVKQNPSAKASRGVVQVRNFLPPDDIETLLRLYQRVEARVLLISKTLGIPGGKLLTADDVLDDVKVMQAFREEYEGDLSPLERLRLHYQELVAADPSLPDRLDALPDGIASAKASDTGGIFACRHVPTRVREEDGDAATWSLDPGQVEWVFRTHDGEDRFDIAGLHALIRSKPDTPHAGFSDRAKLRTTLRKVERDETIRYRKAVQLPLDAPAPRTICWMEVR